MSESGSESSSSESNNDDRSEGSLSSPEHKSQRSNKSGSSRSGSPSSHASGRGSGQRSLHSGPASPSRSRQASPEASRVSPSARLMSPVSGPVSPPPSNPSTPLSARGSYASCSGDSAPPSPDQQNASCPASPNSDHDSNAAIISVNSGASSPKTPFSVHSSSRDYNARSGDNVSDVGSDADVRENFEPFEEASATSLQSHQDSSLQQNEDDLASSIKSYGSGPASPIESKLSKSACKNANNFDSNMSPLSRDKEFEDFIDKNIEDEEELPVKKATAVSHTDDLSDVSDLDNMEDDTQDEKKAEQINDNGIDNMKSSDTDRKEEKMSSLVEEHEQLDFEADGQWKDVKDDLDSEAQLREMKEALKEQINEEEEKIKQYSEVNNKKGSPSKESHNGPDDKAKLNDTKKQKEQEEAGEIDDKEDGQEDGEKQESELEEGELSDGDEARPEETEPRPVCRFYSRGQCTWGVSCRFLHPGVTDKGNYTMFDMVRPVAYPPHANNPHEFRPHMERPPLLRAPAVPYGVPVHHVPKMEDPASESAWERGLRHAKEMMRKANKRKESDMDFEEKKMNLSLGQDELDREAGYYVRAASPEPPVERWPPTEAPPPRRRPPRHTPEYIDEPDPYYHASSGHPEYYRKMHYKDSRMPPHEYRERPDYHLMSRGTPHSSSPPHPSERDREYYHRMKYEKKPKRPTREVIVERVPSSKYREEEIERPVERSRGDEWADPWMRRKSPGSSRRRHGTSSSRRSRKQSYSSGSSYSSSSSSRSSSRASYSSYDSLSRSRSHTPPPRSSRTGNKRVPLSPPPSSSISSHRGGMLMNPPAPSPGKGSKDSHSPPAVGLHRRALNNPPPPNTLISSIKQKQAARDKAAIAAAAVAKVIKSRSRSRSSGSSSGSESSGSSSGSSDSSYSSSSSVDNRRRKERKGSTPPLPIRNKGEKGIDALKLAGAKQQIKLTLKPPNQNLPAVKKIDRSQTIAGKKRIADASPPDSKSNTAAAAKAAKKASSRREELLKQLKAVEDAIARKRSKV